MKKKRALVIGGGNEGRNRIQRLTGNVRARDIDCSGLVEGVAVLDIEDPKKVRDRVGIPDIPVYDWETISGVVEKKGPFDSVFVCTPISTHLEVFHSVVWMGLGRRVLIEKPLEVSLICAFQISVLARKQNIDTFCAYHVPNWGPAVKLEERLSETNTKVGTVICSYTKNRIAAFKDHLIPKGGILDEEGPHVISLARMVMGENPFGVQVIHRTFSPIQVDVSREEVKVLNLKGIPFENLKGKMVLEKQVVGEIIFSLHYRNGRVVLVDSSFDSAEQDRSLKVRAQYPIDTKSPSYKDSLFWAKASFVQTKEKQPFYVERSGEGTPGQFTVINEKETDFDIDLGDIIGLETQHFLKGEDDSLCSFQEAFEHQVVLEALQYSLGTVKNSEEGVIIPGAFVRVMTI